MDNKKVTQYIPLIGGVALGLTTGLLIKKGSVWTVVLTLVGAGIGGTITAMLIAKNKVVEYKNKSDESFNKDVANSTKQFNEKNAKSEQGFNDAKILEFFKTLERNPPKSKAEAEARASKFGLTRADISDYNARNK